MTYLRGPGPKRYRAASKIQKAFRKRKAKAKAKSVKAIAKKEILSMAETKYFNVNKAPATGTDIKPGCASTVGGGHRSIC